MTTRLTISVPDVDAQLAAGYDRIRLFRGPSVDGPFVEITAAAPTPAALTGALAGPFAVHGLTLTMRANGGPVQSVTLATPAAASANDVPASIVTQTTGVTAADNGSNHLQLTTNGAGTDESLELLGDLSTLTALGFSVGQTDRGEAERIPLVAGITSYTFEDIGGTDSDYYRVDFFNTGTEATSDQSAPVRGQTVENVPRQQAESRSPRGLTLVRKTSHVFREAFLTDQGTSLVPIDASRYPSFQIVDINGQVVSAGLATLDGTVGNYRVEFYVPADALISNDDRRWRIEWLLIDQNNRQVEKTTEFDVRDTEVTSSPIRDQKLMALCDRPYRLFIRELGRPYQVRMDLEQAGAGTKVVENVVYPPTGDPSETALIETVDGETYLYSYDIPAGVLSAGLTYQAVWSITSTVASAPEFAFQIIEVPNPVVLQYFPSLRMCIDKYQKRKEIIQAFQDSDVYEYLIRGLEIVNGWHPLTSWTIGTVPSQITPFWLLASQVWALNAQHLLEVDLNFDFCLDQNELVRTDRGLMRLRDLAGVDNARLMNQRLLSSDELSLLSRVSQTMVGFLHAQAIVEQLSLERSAQSLGMLFARAGFGHLRVPDHRGRYLWNVSAMAGLLSGFMEPPRPPRVSTDRTLRSQGVDRTVKHVNLLGQKPCLSIRTELGYEIVGTAEHRFLSLDPRTLEQRWVPAGDLEAGDLVAVDLTPDRYDDTWEVPLPHPTNHCNATKQIYRLPDRLTPSLARVLGHLLAEGTCTQGHQVIFGVGDPELLALYAGDFEDAFGSPPDDLGFGVQHPNQYAYQEDVKHTNIRYLGGRGVELRRFLAGCGLGYERSRDKTIPWSILSAPLPLVREFLRAYFDGDGCFTPTQIFFCSFSPTLRRQLQALLLRFGVLSRNQDPTVTVRGPSLERYRDLVGFRHKGGVVELSDMTIREALPASLAPTLHNITQLFGLRRGWRDGTRYKIGWARRDLIHINYRHLDRWWDLHHETANALDPVVAARIDALRDRSVSWQPIALITPVGVRTVMDPSLHGGPGLLDHAFTAGGFVTHNSGQTVTLSYDHTAGLEAGIQRAMDFLNERLTPAKTTLYRRAAGVGTFAGKPYRYNALHNFTVPIAQYSSSDFLNLLTKIGLL